jgi:hypothetical protein
MNNIFSGFEGFIADRRLTENEVVIIKWQYGYFGSFYKALIDCYRKADTDNKARLEKGFPEIGRAMAVYDHEKGFYANCEKLAEKFNLNYLN